MREAIHIQTTVGICLLGKWWFVQGQDGMDIVVIEEFSNELYPETPPSSWATLRADWVMNELYEAEQDDIGELTELGK